MTTPTNINSGSGLTIPEEARQAMCLCGHARERHAGRTHRGICYPCYGSSDSGPPGSYCGRFQAAALRVSGVSADGGETR